MYGSKSRKYWHFHAVLNQISLLHINSSVFTFLGSQQPPHPDSWDYSQLWGHMGPWKRILKIFQTALCQRMSLPPSKLNSWLWARLSELILTCIHQTESTQLFSVLVSGQIFKYPMDFCSFKTETYTHGFLSRLHIMHIFHGTNSLKPGDTLTPGRLLFWNFCRSLFQKDPSVSARNTALFTTQNRNT